MKKKLMAVLVSVMLVVMAVSLCVGLSACGQKNVLKIGVTDYPPMDYEDESGEWTGFDAEMAKLVAKELGYDGVEFVEITWDYKITELKSKKIDLIWNGMTVTDELAEEMIFSYSYATNSQVAVIKNTNASVFTDLASMAEADVVCEGGSAGEAEAVAQFGADNVTGLEAQVNALAEVLAGTADVAFVDYTLAKSQCGKGDYATLMIVEGIELSKEEFAVGIRKEDTALQEGINKALVKFYNDGTMEALRVQFGKDVIALMDLSNK